MVNKKVITSKFTLNEFILGIAYSFWIATLTGLNYRQTFTGCKKGIDTLEVGYRRKCFFHPNYESLLYAQECYFKTI